MKPIKLIAIIIFLFVISLNPAFCDASNHKIKELILDNSDNIVLIKGEGNFKNQGAIVPVNNSNSLNILTNVSTFTISSPSRFVVDIPQSTLIGSSRTYTLNNSDTIKSIFISQFSVNPKVVRVVFNLIDLNDAKNFKVYSNGKDIIVKYKNPAVENSIKYKFYTPLGDMDKTSNLQDLNAALTYTNANETINIIPNLTTKYYLNQITQSPDGLILRGIGSVSIQRTTYNNDNTEAEIIIDNAKLSSKLENKTFTIPSSNPDLTASILINRLGSKKISLILNGKNLRDYRFIVSPEGQSIFIAHRTYIINTIFASGSTNVSSYKITKNSNGYILFDLNFSSPVAYDVFELNDNFYLDINNLSDYSQELLNQALKSNDIKVEALKISSDKTRYIIPTKGLNFSYANVESNSKSITLCFKEKPKEVLVNNYEVVPNNSTPKKVETPDNLNVLYVPKEEEIKKDKPKKSKENISISSLKKVVIDPGHGGSDTGAIGGGINEKTINLEVSKLIEEKLKKKNIHVYMTRNTDKTLTLEDRTNYSNEINPDIYVSIHVNSSVAKDPFGLETHYYKDDSLELANIIHKHFASDKNLKKWNTKDRGVIKSRFYVINHTEAPSILIEIGFISNASERAKLITKQRQEEIAESVTKGILEYLKVK